jgi:hypothetical protein
MALTVSTGLAEVSVHYSPTEISPGVATPITISLQDETGTGLEIVGIVMDFIAPAGLSLDGFTWSSGFDEGPLWLATVELPRVETASFGAGRVVPDGGTLEVGVFTVTAAADTAGTLLTLQVLPEPSDAMIVDAEGLRNLEIVSGRDVDLTVSGTSDGGSDPPDNGGTDSGTDDGDSTPPDDDSDPDGGADADSGNQNGNDSDGQPDDSAGDDGDSGAIDGPALAGPCGMAMLPFGLFTLAFLSAMKMNSRRRTS